MKDQDYYDILGIKEDSNPQQIREAYKKLAPKWHPDKNLNQRKIALLKFQDISHAYSVLKDKDQKLKYDRQRKDALRSQNIQKQPIIIQKNIPTAQPRIIINYNPSSQFVYNRPQYQFNIRQDSQNFNPTLNQFQQPQLIKIPTTGLNSSLHNPPSTQFHPIRIMVPNIPQPRLIQQPYVEKIPQQNQQFQNPMKFDNSYPNIQYQKQFGQNQYQQIPQKNFVQSNIYPSNGINQQKQRFIGQDSIIFDNSNSNIQFSKQFQQDQQQLLNSRNFVQSNIYPTNNLNQQKQTFIGQDLQAIPSPNQTQSLQQYVRNNQEYNQCYQNIPPNFSLGINQKNGFDDYDPFEKYQDFFK